MSSVDPAQQFGIVARDVAAGMSGLAFLTGMLNRIYPAPPFTQTTGIWLVEAESGRVVFEAVPSAAFYNPLGTVHGGWISALLDSAMGCAVHSMLPSGQLYTTVDMSVSFVRPVLKSTGKLRCEGKIIHSGSRIATADGRLWDSAGRLVAHGSETCLVVPLPPPPT
jgi:uncharacterized protein (TIGR00369 family)